MPYCPLSRFQGSWLGSIIGEALVSGKQQSQRLKIVRYEPKEWLKPRMEIAATLIKCPEFSPEQDWLFSTNRSDRLAVLLLPWIMLTADNMNLFKETVQENTSFWHGAAEDVEDVLIWGYANSLALKKKLDPNNLVEQILTGVKAKFTALSQKKLKAIARAGEQGKPLKEIVEELSKLGKPQKTAVILSLYCFSSTPENFYLSVCRALATGYQLETTVPLTAALSGAYNSFTGIPISWRRAGNSNLPYQQAMRKATELHNTWLGVYSQPNNNSLVTAVTSPRTMQTRSSLKIISQTEY